jgi:hypothetical protein
MEVAYAILATTAEMTPQSHLHMLNGGIDGLIGPFPGICPVPIYLAVKLFFLRPTGLAGEPGGAASKGSAMSLVRPRDGP